MKKVVLLGDSIRLGYESTVKKELAGLAEVWSPTDNGQHTLNLLLNFWSWVQQQQPDILHLNAGLWDVRNVLRGQPDNLVPLDQYRQNLQRLLQLAAQTTRARIIWATTTPVDIAHNMQHHAATGHPGRTEGDVERYNAAALEITTQLGIPVNDLHALVLREGKANMLCPDGVHMTDAGYTLLGHAVAEKIRPLL